MSEEECNSQGSKVCSIGENSCTYEQRRINGVTYHSKGCKQANACLSNQYQNSGPFFIILNRSNWSLLVTSQNKESF